MKWKYTPKQDDRAVPVACCDLVHRGRELRRRQDPDGDARRPGARARRQHGQGGLERQERRPDQGRDDDDGRASSSRTSTSSASRAASSACADGWPPTTSTTASSSWKAYSMGPDEDIKLAADFNSANPHYGQRGEGTKTWPGEHVEAGRRHDLGLVLVGPRPEPPLLLDRATRAPGTRRRGKGDNKWSMTIFARNPDTGEAKWAYQMTPWDAWDFDGINEHILADLNIGGKKVKALIHFDRNGFALHARPDQRDAARRRAVRVRRTGRRASTRRPGGPSRWPTKRTKQGEDTKDICPCAMGGQGSAAGRLLAQDRARLRRHQQHVHELRGRGGEVHRGRPLGRRERADDARPRWPPR